MSDMSRDGVEPGGASVNPPAAPRPLGQKIMLGVVIFLGLLIVLGLGAVVVGMTMKIRGGSSPGRAAAQAASLTLPPGASIEAMEVSGNRLILRLRTPAGEEIDIVDTQDGHVVSRIAAAPPEIPR